MNEKEKIAKRVAKELNPGDICKEHISELKIKANEMNIKNIICKSLDMRNISFDDNSFLMQSYVPLH